VWPVFRRLVFLVVCLMLAGCGAQIAAMNGIAIVDPGDKAAVLANMKAEADPYEGATKITGPTIFHDRNLLGKTYTIRSWISPNNPALNDRFQIYVTANFNEWAFLDQAYADGHMLDTSRISRDVGYCSGYGCSVTETVGVNFSEAELARYAATGLSFKIAGKRQDIVMTIPGAYVAAVIEFHDAHRGKGGAAKAS
jgi:hypothetical protein